MMKLVGAALLAVTMFAGPAAANHIFNPGPYPSRGACEAESAHLSQDDQQSLLQRFPDLFSSPGEVSSFLTRAFTCEPGANGWYIVDHRQEVLDSEWFQRRLR